MEILNKAGIYLIYNLANQRVYVGQSKNVATRLRTHKSKLKRSCHTNPYLQNAFNKYGEDKFVFRSVEYPEDCSPKNLTIREQHWIDQFNSMNPNRGYNLREAGENGGHSLETRAKIGAASTGRSHSEEVKEKLREAFIGKPLSAEHREKLSSAKIGKTRSKEVCDRLSEAHKGKTISEETRLKISESRKRYFENLRSS